jgi:hypothetical protein
VTQNPTQRERAPRIEREQRLQNIPTNPTQVITRSGWVSRKKSRYNDFIAYDLLLSHHNELSSNYNQNISMGATNDPDTLYYHEALKEPDKEEFIKANDKRIGKNWRLVQCDSLPTGTQVLPSVWALR